jgi:putative transposase
MARNLIRYQQCGDFHFVNFSCYRNQQNLDSAGMKELFEHSLEKIRLRYDFGVIGYVVMPDHVHLLVSESKRALLSKAIQALKLSVTMQQKVRPFWQRRYYDFNVFTVRKHIEKLRYIHRNPVRTGLVEKPQDWAWSSFRHYLTGEIGVVEIESQWTATRRESASQQSHFSKSRSGPPHPRVNLRRRSETCATRLFIRQLQLLYPPRCRWHGSRL